MDTEPAGAKYLIPTITADAAINASVAPKVFATLVNAPRMKVPMRIPSTSPMNPLNHSYADFTPPFASTMDTMMEKIPTIRDTYWPILVCVSKLNSFLVSLAWMSRVQLAATEFSPVDRVDWDAA